MHRQVPRFPPNHNIQLLAAFHTLGSLRPQVPHCWIRTFREERAAQQLTELHRTLESLDLALASNSMTPASYQHRSWQVAAMVQPVGVPATNAGDLDCFSIS